MGTSSVSRQASKIMPTNTIFGIPSIGCASFQSAQKSAVRKIAMFQRNKSPTSVSEKGILGFWKDSENACRYSPCPTQGAAEREDGVGLSTLIVKPWRSHGLTLTLLRSSLCPAGPYTANLNWAGWQTGTLSPIQDFRFKNMNAFKDVWPSVPMVSLPKKTRK